MIKGYLNILLLKELNKEDQTGYSLIKIFKEKYGGVSPGSLYPMLSNLEENKYIKCKEEGNKKIYSITVQGKSTLAKLLKEKKEFIEHISGSPKKFKGIIDDKEFEKLEKFLSILHSHDEEFLTTCVGMNNIRESIVDAVQNKKLTSTNKELSEKIKGILDQAANKINKLR